MKKDKRGVQGKIAPVLTAVCLMLSGCGSVGLAQEATFESAYQNGQEQEPVDIYTSQATGVVQFVDDGNQEVNFFLFDRNESRTLGYTGGTLVGDQYGSPLTISQLKAGDVVEITYNSELSRLGQVMLSADAFTYSGVTKYNLSAGNGTVTIGEESYDMNPGMQVFSEGRQIGVDEVINQDVLTFQGKGHSIMSITVDKGHGYLDLTGEDAFLGGWIEVGQTTICQIAPDMLLTVPEGTYTVRLTGDKLEESREVTIRRNQETILDLSDVEIPPLEKGVVILDVTPSSAKVAVDGTSVETTYPLRLSAGLHQLSAEADGYDSITEYFKVETEKTTVTLDLSKKKTVSENSISTQSENGATLTIAAPEDVEVYQDNLYMGLAPVTYTKTAGSHTITLRKEGYVTRSHDIEITDDNRDVTYSFPDLEPQNGSSVSGNSISGNTLSPSPSPSAQADTVSGNSISENSIDDNKTNNSGNSNT